MKRREHENKNELLEVLVVVGGADVDQVADIDGLTALDLAVIVSKEEAWSYIILSWCELKYTCHDN